MNDRGRVTVRMTPELRQLAFDRVRELYGGEKYDDLANWFTEGETPDGYVLDADADAAEAQMIVVIAQALL